MAYFAKLDQNNVVLEVHAIHNNELLDENGIEQEQKGIDFLIQWSGGHPYWKQTSYNKRIRKNYCGPGWIYDQVRNAFIPPKPTPNSTLDEATCHWIVPQQIESQQSIGADTQ